MVFITWLFLLSRILEIVVRAVFFNSAIFQNFIWVDLPPFSIIILIFIDWIEYRVWKQYTVIFMVKVFCLRISLLNLGSLLRIMSLYLLKIQRENFSPSSCVWVFIEIFLYPHKSQMFPLTLRITWLFSLFWSWFHVTARCSSSTSIKSMRRRYRTF